jgi:hypothetical protein
MGEQKNEDPNSIGGSPSSSFASTFSQRGPLQNQRSLAHYYKPGHIPDDP